MAPGPPCSWDSKVAKASDAFKDFGTYYLYYHATGSTDDQIGEASSPHPPGPFSKLGDAPALPAGPEGRWNSRHATCAMVPKESAEKYLM